MNAVPVPFAERLPVLRGLCRFVIVGLVGFAFGVGMIVWFALEGQPLAGNFATVGGVSVVTLGIGVLALASVPVSLQVGRMKTRAGVLAVVGGHPELIDPATDADRLADAYAAGVFAEYAIAGGMAFAAAVVMHVTSDPLTLVCVAGLDAFLIARFPSTARAARWFAAAQATVAGLR